MSEQNFGAPNHYYAQPIHNRLHGPAHDTPAERQVREILATNDEVFEKVDKTCKRWNPIIREILRSETALKLSINEDRRIIPVRVVDGLPKPFVNLVSEMPDPILWRINNNRALFEGVGEGLNFMHRHFEEIQFWLKREQPVDKEFLFKMSELNNAILSKLKDIKFLQAFKEIREDVLGAYFFRDGIIQLYWMPIGIMANVLNISIEDLTIVVLTHELAHAYTHMGADIDGVRWSEKAFAECDLRIVEGLAQHYTEIICKKIEEKGNNALTAFEKLLNCQSTIYTVFREWTNGEQAAERIRFTLLITRSQKICSYDDFHELLASAPFNMVSRKLPLKAEM